MGHVFVTDPVADAVIDRLRRDHEVTLGYGPRGQSWEDVQDSIEAALVRSENISRERIVSAPLLKIVARHGVGTDNVDLVAAAEAGVWVTTTPGANAQAVAEHVFALALTLMRGTAEGASRVKAGTWSEGRADLVGVQLSGKTLLLVGAGEIPRLVAPIARGFGMNILAHDPYVTDADAHELGADLVDLEAGLAEADVVSLHVPLTEQTMHLFDDRHLGMMRESAFLINTSRGGVIDEQALVARLRSRQLAGAAMDVIEAEKFNMNDPLAYSVTDFSLPNLLVTPHIAGQTQESLDRVGMLAAESIEHALAGNHPPRALDLALT